MVYFRVGIMGKAKGNIDFFAKDGFKSKEVL